MILSGGSCYEHPQESAACVNCSDLYFLPEPAKIAKTGEYLVDAIRAPHPQIEQVKVAVVPWVHGWNRAGISDRCGGPNIGVDRVLHKYCQWRELRPPHANRTSNYSPG